MDDDRFRTYCQSFLDTDYNGKVSPEEAAAVTELDLSRQDELTSLKGIEYFTGLESLNLYFCKSLQELDLSKNTALVTLDASYCSALTRADISAMPIETLSGGMFANCRELAEVVLPAGLTAIADSPFENCAKLEGLELPATLTSIGDSAFEECTGLKSLTIPESVTAIGSRAFYNCNSLTEIKLPEGMESIGEQAFMYCSSLESMTWWPESITTIEGSTFNSCTSMTSVTIPASVTAIGGYAFWDCNALTSVTCLATTPPAIGDGYTLLVFSDTIQDQVTLYVPVGCEQAYADLDWSFSFTNIQVIE